MKLTHKLCGAALLAAVGIAVALPNNTKATDGVGVEGKAKIEFTTTDDTDTTVPNLSGSGDGPITSGGETSDAKGFGISYVSDLDFDKHSIVGGQITGSYYAKTWVGNAGAADEVKNSNHINFEDVRVGTDHSYEITAKITTPFTSDLNKGAEGTTPNNVALNGTTIKYNNMGLRNTKEGSADAALAPTNGLNEGATISDAGVTPMLTNKKPEGHTGNYETGYGKWTLYFGEWELDNDATDGNKGANKSVLLDIPKADNKVIYNAEYKAGITWTMSATFQP